MEHWMPSIRLNVLRHQMIVNQFVHQTCEHQIKVVEKFQFEITAFHINTTANPLEKRKMLTGNLSFSCMLWSLSLSTMHLSVCPKILWTRLHKRKHFEEEFYFDFRFYLELKFSLKLNFIIVFYLFDCLML